ncbi:hypothetical protein ACWC9Q_37840, partial [Streptomyces sp. NPDC001142]
NNTHNSSGTNRSTKSVMHGPTSDHAKRNDVLSTTRSCSQARRRRPRPGWYRSGGCRSRGEVRVIAHQPVGAFAGVRRDTMPDLTERAIWLICDLERNRRRRETGLVDSTLWVAVFTGGTAVLASWVTSRGTARAARIQVEASSRAQQLDQIRELRRAAYADVIGRAHETAELYFQVKGALTGPDEELVQRIEELRGELRVAFDPLMRCIRLAVLEGPTRVAEAAEALGKSVVTANRALHPLEQSGDGAQAVYELSEAEFHRRLEKFTASAREALSSIQ